MNDYFRVITRWSVGALLLLPFFFFSCESGTSDLAAASTSDSLPPAIRAINERINKDRDNADLYAERARSWFDLKDFETAISDMKIALKIDSTKPEYLIFISDLYFTRNETKQTRDFLRKAMQYDSTNGGAMRKYSQLFYLLKQYDTAMFYVNRSLHFEPMNSTGHFQKGMILKETGDTLKAISSFQSAVEVDQQNADAFMQLGLLFSAANDPLAIGYFNNVLRIKPGSEEAFYGKAKFLQDLGELDKALVIYEHLVDISPDHLDAMFNIGTILFLQEKYDEALSRFDVTIQRNVNFFKGYYGKGRVLEAMGKTSEAIKEYQHCLALQPDFTLAALQLQRLK